MAAFNRIKLYSQGKTFTFEDADYILGSVQDVLANSLIGVDLSIDELSFTIRSRKDSPDEYLYDENDELIYDENDEPISVLTLNYANVDFANAAPYRDIVELYHGNTLEGKFYVQSVRHIGRGGGWEFVCCSAMGIIDRQLHAGGIYFNDSAGDLIAEIMGRIPYSIEADVAATPIYGWLPYSTGRDNLRQLLFAIGASALKDANGNLLFTFQLPAAVTSKKIPDVYEGSSIETITPVSEVKLTEHTFYASSLVDPEVLYEAAQGVSVSHFRIVFDKPYHTLNWTGTSIDASGANWAEISGTGVLTGIPYVHIQREKTKATGVSAAEASIAITDATLIGQINADVALDRLAAYYAQTSEVSANVVTDVKPGSLLKIPNPNDFSKTVMGYVKSASRTYSSIVKSTLKLTQGWTPGSTGNAYDSYQIFERSDISGGSLSIPAEMRGKRALVVLFSGAQGGQGGYDGEAGGDSYSPDPDRQSWWEGPVYGGIGGEGGSGGSPGGCGRYLQIEIPSLANSYSAAIGLGGAGGAHNGELGVIGGDTTFGSNSTASGVVPAEGYVNIIDGTLYGESGNAGTAGKAGGKAGDFRSYRSESDYDDGQAGENYNNTWRGGAGYPKIRVNTTYGRSYASGSGGGGAAYGNSGGAAYANENGRWSEAGAGANATTPAKAGFYRGGDGGHGGGGGGGGAYEYHWQGSFNTWHFSDGGAAGLGSSGGQGADGFILIYYKA